MSVAWSKDVDAALAQAKPKRVAGRYYWISALRPLEAHALGWMPSRMRTPPPRVTSKRTSCRYKLTSRNTPPGSTASMCCGLPRS